MERGRRAPEGPQRGGGGRGTGQGSRAFGQGGRGGQTPPPPPPRSSSSGSTPGRGSRSSSAGFGQPAGRGGGGTPPAPRRGTQGRGQHGAPRASPQASSPAGAGQYRAGQQGGSWPRSQELQGSARLFGSGPEAVLFERDKEPGIWKVAPPPGQRFSLGFLQGISKFISFQLSKQQGRRQQQQAQPSTPPPAPPLAAASAAAAGLGVGQGRAAATTPPRGGGMVPIAASPPASVGVPQSLPLLSQEGQQQEQQGEGGEGELNELVCPTPEDGISSAVGDSGEEAEGVGEEEEEEAEQFEACSRLRQEGEEVGLAKEEAGEEALIEAAGDAPSTPPPPPVGPGTASAAATADWAAQQHTAHGPGQPCADAGTDPGSSEVFLRVELHVVPSAQRVGSGEGCHEPPTDPQSPGSPRVLLCLCFEQHAAPAPTPAAWGEQAPVGAGRTQEGVAPPPGSPCRRGWWPANALAEHIPPGEVPAVPVEEGSSCGGGSGGRQAAGQPVQLCLRLERMGLTDPEAAMLADWHAREAGQGGAAAGAAAAACAAAAAGAAAGGCRLVLRKLWLFDNQLGDVGAAHVARMLGPGLMEVHLSHNRISAEGAAALLAALPAPAPGPAARPLWLRLEWNRISLETLMEALEREHAQRGLVVDIPQPTRTDAAPSLPRLPAYLACPPADGGSGAGPTAEGRAGGESSGDADGPAVLSPGGKRRQAPPAGPGTVTRRGGRNTLQFLADPCHARLPWLSCQYQLPREAEVLRTARSAWGAAAAAPAPAVGAAALQAPPLPQAGGADAGRGPPAASSASRGRPDDAPGVPCAAAAATGTALEGGAGGPLLLFPDTSALLSMLGAHASVAQRTGVTLRALADLAQAGRFGRALAPQEQVFVVVTDSVAKQLDGLKADPAARAAIRHFMGAGLDTYGPAGLDFLTVLGGHEGEGLVVEHEAQVAGSASRDVGSVGQRMDHKIVEVALFFLRQITQAAPAGVSPAGAPPGGTSPAIPVLLLSGDNAQVQLAKSHGLPAVRLAELAPLERWLQLQQAPAPQAQSAPALGASLVRKLLGTPATTGLGSVALRPIHREFDGAVACLRATADALHTAHSTLAAMRAALYQPAGMPPEAALAALRGLLPPAAPEAGSGGWRELEGPLADSAPPPGDGGGAPGPGAAERSSAVRAGPSGGPFGADWVQGAGQLAAAVRQKLQEWEGLVRSHQSPHRVLRWAGAS